MRVLLTGGRGQLGTAIRALAKSWAWELFAPAKRELDITQSRDVLEACWKLQPEVIINAAAYTAVDKAESEPEQAFLVNAQAVASLAKAANDVGALLVQISTDYVFDGRNSHPYREEDEPNPLSVYGKSKLGGEQAARTAREHLVIRTSWLFGDGWNFVEAIRKQLANGAKMLRVVADQKGRPTFAPDLAKVIAQLVEKGERGLFHAANNGTATWAEFAGEIVAQLGLAVPVVPISTEEANRPAPRPSYSVLDTSRLEAVVGPLPNWQNALSRYLRGSF
ncbi:MAG: dTDP-4-dehydrorhamnose reductase [Thermoanaerobaculaceae bacterium]